MVSLEIWPAELRPRPCRNACSTTSLMDQWRSFASVLIRSAIKLSMWRMTRSGTSVAPCHACPAGKAWWHRSEGFAVGLLADARPSGPSPGEPGFGPLGSAKTPPQHGIQQHRRDQRDHREHEVAAITCSGGDAASEKPEQLARQVDQRT